MWFSWLFQSVQNSRTFRPKWEPCSSAERWSIPLTCENPWKGCRRLLSGSCAEVKPCVLCVLGISFPGPPMWNRPRSGAAVPPPPTPGRLISDWIKELPSFCNKQECISVGCLPPALYRMGRGVCQGEPLPIWTAISPFWLDNTLFTFASTSTVKF